MNRWFEAEEQQIVDTLIEIASMSTDSRLDEAHLFLRARKLAQDLCRDLELPFTDNTFGGKISP